MLFKKNNNKTIRIKKQITKVVIVVVLVIYEIINMGFIILRKVNTLSEGSFIYSFN